MILKCKDCGFIKDVYEADVMDSISCEICGGAMLTEKDVDRLEAEEKDNAVGDNFPVIPQREENDTILRMAEREINSNLKILGDSNCWNLIEKISNAKLRLQYRAIFFKLGAKMPEKESLE
jgi:hypothetical protein